MEMTQEIPQKSSETGMQAGSALASVQKLLGRSRALDVLKQFRSILWDGDQPLRDSPVGHKLKSFQLLVEAPGVLAFEKPCGF